MLLKVSHLYFFSLLSTLVSASALTHTIDFNDGIDGGTVANFYSIAKGVTFQNTAWDSLSSGYTPALESTGLRIGGIGPDYQPKVGNPLVARFDQAMKSISLIANSVNLNGARIDAYDALSGGSLIDFDQVVGSSGNLNSNFTLEVQGTGIRRIEFYQPFSVETEGVLFDNLTFTAVPEPSMLSLIMAIGAFAVGRRRRR